MDVLGGALLSWTPLLKGLKGYLNLGLPDRALGGASPGLLHNLVKVGVVPLSLHGSVYCMEGRSVFRQGHKHD